jgi:hypothetical protein
VRIIKIDVWTATPPVTVPGSGPTLILFHLGEPIVATGGRGAANADNTWPGVYGGLASELVRARTNYPAGTGVEEGTTLCSLQAFSMLAVRYLLSVPVYATGDPAWPENPELNRGPVRVKQVPATQQRAKAYPEPAWPCPPQYQHGSRLSGAFRVAPASGPASGGNGFT